MKKPFTFAVPMPAAKFEEIHAKLDGHPAATTGSLNDKDVSLDWSYAPESLTINVTQAHSFEAKLASNAMIQSRIEAMLASAEA